jgi:hypothetical protein
VEPDSRRLELLKTRFLKCCHDELWLEFDDHAEQASQVLAIELG